MRGGRWLAWGLCLLLPWLGGCTALVARQIEHPGRHQEAVWDAFGRVLERGRFRHAGMQTSPDVRIAYWYGQPYDYDANVTVHVRRKAHSVDLDFGLDFSTPPDQAAPLPVRGSILLLHPWGMQGAMMAGWGLLFASSGYVVVMPDLRSHGDSSDAPVGYGPREAADMVALVRRLRADGRLPSPLYLFGASYGATVALFAAPQLPPVQGVIALEPYANAAAVIGRAPASGLFGHSWLVRWLTPARMNRAIDRAGRQLGVDLHAIGPGDAVAHTPACELIVHDGRDRLTSAAALQALARRSPRARYVEVPDDGHATLPLRTDRLFAPLLHWLQALPGAGDGACPAFALPRPTAPRG